MHAARCLQSMGENFVSPSVPGPSRPSATFKILGTHVAFFKKIDWRTGLSAGCLAMCPNSCSFLWVTATHGSPVT